MKKILCLLFALALILSLPLPALAANYSEYGLFYDETETLDWDIMQATEDAFLELGEEFGVEFRVDVVSDMEGYPIYEYAEHYYNEYEYGYGDDRTGVLLMMNMVEDETGAAFQEACFWINGPDPAYLEGLVELAETYVGACLVPEAWSGDWDSDTAVLDALMSTYVAVARGYLSGDLEEIESGAPILPTEETEPVEIVPTEAIPTLNYITDDYGLLTESEAADLENRARELAQQYDCWVYAVIVDDFSDYSTDMKDACRVLYEQFDVASQVNGNAIFLLLSMSERDYYIQDFGEYGQYVMTNYGRESLEDAMLDDLAEDDWYDGLMDYLDQAEVLLEAAAGGTKYDDYEIDPDYSYDYDYSDYAMEILLEELAVCYGGSFVIAVIVALIVCSIFKRQMKSAVIATSAERYVSPMGPDIQIREDHYTHTTRTERRIERDNDSSSSSGSDGDSGGGGKF